MDKGRLAAATYEKTAKRYAEKYQGDQTDFPYIEYFLALLPKSGVVLDVGSGPGQHSRLISNLELKAIGIDLSERMIAMAKDLFPEGNFRFMDMRFLEFENDTIDGILAAHSLVHVPTEDIEMTLKGFYRVLKPGGYLEIIVQEGEPDQLIEIPFLPGESMFFNLFTMERLKTFFKLAGFQICHQDESSSADSTDERTLYVIARKPKTV